MKKKVIVAGHICLDITPVFSEKGAMQPGDILVPGRLVDVGQADVHTGGAVANTGLAMKFFGADVSLMGKIGNDPFGEIILNILKAHGAKQGMLVSDQESTSYSVVIAIPGIDRIFLHNPGANHTFCAEDVPDGELEKAALFHFGYPPLMKTMYENNGAELVCLMKRAKEYGTATSLDFAAVDPASIIRRHADRIWNVWGRSWSLLCRSGRICAALREAMFRSGCCPEPAREIPVLPRS